MKVTVENNINEYILNRIKNVYIGFDDNVEVKLDQISDYDINLDKIDSSIIELTNILGNVELQNHFKGKSRIIYVHIEFVGIDITGEQEFKVLYDIPCDMVIRNLRICSGDMFVELEGIVK